MTDTGKLRRVETVDCLPFDAELKSLASHLSEVRTKSIGLHRHTRSVELATWMPLATHNRDLFAALHAQSSRLTAEAAHFPTIVTWIYTFAERHAGWASRAQIVVLEPRKEVYLHADWGLYYALRDRYHLVLSSEGSVMISGTEEKLFKTGDVFFYPNKVRHGARNDSDSARIHLIFDLLPKNKWQQLSRFLRYLFVLKRHQRAPQYPLTTFEEDVLHFNTALQERHFLLPSQDSLHASAHQ